MIKYVIVYAIGLIIGLIAGWYLSTMQYVKRSSDGICIRTDEGEVYLRMSEAGQIKLSNPSTKYLMLKVQDVSTRNKHPL